MCLMAFALHPSPTLGLLLAANRDESLARPTQALHAWHTAAGTPVWAGRDLLEGGTWLGTTPSGRMGLLTNVRDPAPTPAPRSRGELVTHWLDTARTTPHTPAAQAAANWVAWLGPRALDYGGFNLVLGDVAQGRWWWLNNRPDRVWPTLPAAVQALTTRPHPHLLVAELPPGVYGLSNAGLNTPWPKTWALTQALQAELNATPQAALPQAQPTASPPLPGDGATSAQPPTQRAGPWHASHRHPSHLHTDSPLAPSPLWRTLADRTLTPDDQLPHTGVPTEWERALSAIWVDMPTAGYGTRSSLLMQVQRPDPTAPDWQVHMLERTWRPADAAGWAQAQWAFPGQPD